MEPVLDLVERLDDHNGSPQYVSGRGEIVLWVL